MNYPHPAAPLVVAATAVLLASTPLAAQAPSDLPDSAAAATSTYGAAAKRNADTERLRGARALEQIAAAAEQAAAADEYERAAELFGKVLSSALFPEFEATRRHSLLMQAAEVASVRADFLTAQKLYVRSTDYALAGAMEWMGRLNAAWFLGDLDDAVDSLALIAQRWPGELNSVSQWAMEALLDHTRERQPAAELPILRALFDAGWQTDLGREPTAIWMRLIDLLVEREYFRDALGVSSRLRDPIAVVAMLSDRKYAAVIDAGPDWFSVAETLDAGIIEARLSVEANPHLLAPAVRLAEVLLYAGRTEDALLVIETHLARASIKSVIGEALEDAVAESVRALSVKARALTALERLDEAALQLELAAEQVLPVDRIDDYYAVAELQIRLGHPDAALRTLDRMPPRINDVRATLIRFMAARLYGDQKTQQRALDTILARAGDAPEYAQHALLLAGKTDAAARLLIKRLEHPRQRRRALIELQTLREQKWPAAELDWQSRTHALMARSDVRESIADNGGIVASYDVYRWTEAPW